MESTVDNKGGWTLSGDGPEAYERYIVPAFSGAWAQDMVNRARLQGGDRVLDLGCGTGIVSRHVWKAMGESVCTSGMDANEAVLQKARALSPERTVPIEWNHGHAESLPYSNATFNVVLCQQGLQYFSDACRALGEVKRVLVPKGRIVFSVWRPLSCFPFYSAVHRALHRYVSSQAAATLASAFPPGNAGDLKKLFTATGFRHVGISLVIKQMRYSPLDEFLMGGFAASPFAGEILALEKAKREEMIRWIRESIWDYVDDQGLAAPMESYVVTAQA